MKSRLLRASMIAIAISLVSTAAFAGAHKYRLRVDGLACPFCAYGIEKKLNAAKGVKSIQIDINTGTVTVFMKPGASLSEAQARQIVKDAGFTLGNFQTIPAPIGKAEN